MAPPRSDIEKECRCCDTLLQLSFSFDRVNADLTTIFAPSFKSNLAGYLCIDGVVFTHANVLAHMEPGTTLTDDDGTSRYQLTIVCFRAHALCIGVTAVGSGAAPFMMGV